MQYTCYTVMIMIIITLKIQYKTDIFRLAPLIIITSKSIYKAVLKIHANG